ncbi:MAG: methylmalonyl-CoA mutase family protein, partial [Proteobacteria bacterium]|nr:methylmalonyl-CoA mutase family protein [Pseudomonadota bacterium]
MPKPSKNLPAIRIVTAASLFDGHDASINIMRRILQASGAEVIHLGHNRSVAQIVDAALQEDVNAIALSSYQGGHVEFLKYMVDMLRERGGEKIRIFAGGGGVIVPEEAQELHDYGVTRVYTPEDGQKMGLQGMIDDMLEKSRYQPDEDAPESLDTVISGDRRALSHLLSAIENGTVDQSLLSVLGEQTEQLPMPVPVLGITGTGGAGKSSLTDEIILRFRNGQRDALNIALIAVDPTRRKTGGALLGDRIRMNAIDHVNIFMRSVATRDAESEIPAYVGKMVEACQLAGFDLVIVETPGIGQGDAGITSLVDASLYVMTPEFGAQSQLEKIDMLDFADAVAINKFDRQGAADAYRDVCKQVQRNREAFTEMPETMPVFGTVASRFNDDGVTALYQHLLSELRKHGLEEIHNYLPETDVRCSSNQTRLIPGERVRYLAEIAATVRDYKAQAKSQARFARQRQQLAATQSMLADSGSATVADIQTLIESVDTNLNSDSKTLLENWDQLIEDYSGQDYVVKVRDKEIRTTLNRFSLSGNAVSKVSLPAFEDDGERLKWRLLENVPGQFPYTAGVFAFKRANEMPTRMFAGEGDAQRTNRRFRQLSEHSEAKRLSTAFDSVTLYGCDPDERPDIYGKVGNSGVSIATLDNLKMLYGGFDLCNPTTSVSMTINGPAPMILAMFLNTAIDQQLQNYAYENGKPANRAQAEEIRAWTLANVRGTVQADILKEDQGQNTCIFSTEFALKLMADIQEYFVDHKVRNFYSVSISGYHIAEAGANPISQMAFTLSNGFTYVEAYLARGMDIDDFAPNLSFFFSNGMCP